MNTRLCLFVALSLFVVGIRSDCNIIPVPANLGDKCNPNGNVCPTNAYCAQSGYCLATAGLSEVCSSDAQCSPYSCVNNACVVAKNVQTGGSCTQNTDCISSKATCSANICTVSSSQVCSSNVDCKLGQYCNPSNGKCANSIASGATCSYHYECSQGLACTTNTTSSAKTCSEPFSAEFGQGCNGDGNFVTDCNVANGLYCDSVTMQCQRVKADVCQSCSKDADCTFSNTCVCGGQSLQSGYCQLPRVYNQACKTALLNVIECANDNQCSLGLDYINAPQTCLLNNCLSQLKALQPCNRLKTPPTLVYRYFSGFAGNAADPSQCVTAGNSTGDSSRAEITDSSSSHTGAALTLLVALVALSLLSL